MQRALLPLLVVSGVLAVSGCKLLKKKKPTSSSLDDSTSATTTSSDLDAVNRADITRFPEERRIASEIAAVRVVSVARTAPNDTAATVAVLDVGTVVVKQADRLGSTLVTFNRVAFPGQRFAGWVPDTAFVLAPANANAAAPGKPAGVVAAAGTGTVTSGIATTAAPSGDCKMTLRSSSFVPSSSTCSFNETVRSGGPATMAFPCAGGAASARFGSQTFSGTADKTRVSISTTVFNTFRGCNIRTVQTITGSPPNLNYTLAESIAGGTCNGISTCTARGTISATSSTSF